MCRNKMLPACSAFRYALSCHLRSPLATVPINFHEIVPEMKPAETPARVRFSELLDAFYFVSVDSPYDQGAYINPATGAIFYVSPELDAESETPDDFETSDRYIAVPHKNDLNLGRDLVFFFVDDELPEHFETVAGYFRRKGAYRRFKDFIDRRDLLDKWHAFESRATENELHAWAKAHGIEFTDERPQVGQEGTPDAHHP